MRCLVSITDRRWVTVAALLLLVGCLAFADEPETAVPSVFDIPGITARRAQLQLAIQAAFQAKDYGQAEERCANATKLVPHEPSNYYNLACAQSLQGKRAEAMTSLRKAVELGFRDTEKLTQDKDLNDVRDEKGFKELVELAKHAKPVVSPWTYRVEPRAITDGEALVTESNTAWDVQNQVFRVLFNVDADLKAQLAKVSPVKDHGEAGELLRKWFAEGTAAGNVGDLYDNHDGDHSNLAFAQFPQLTRIEFDEAAKKRGLQTGLQHLFFYNAVTIGNSSTALTQGALWRSQPRLAYTNPRLVATLYNQYTNNHLYFYPEHRDYDAGHNGDGGYGDVYCANTPYLIISQGSSGSDRAFMDAVTCTLASFQPEVKSFLAKNGALMPTIQMLFRHSNQQVKSREDYLSGKAHPTVFDGNQINTLKMVRHAHEIEKESVPPIVHLRVTEEDTSAVGRDYFEFAEREKLFDTPAAIARVFRSTKYVYRMVVSAEASCDLNDHPLKFHWVVLRGDSQAITINPLNEEKSVVELLVPYHKRLAIEPGSDMHSNRVDIGAFVENDKHISAPGFITFYTLDNELRVYNEKKVIQSVEYKHAADGGNFADPLIAVGKSWRDEYKYDKEDRLIGWTRHRGDEKQEFTHDGALVLETDELGRASKAQKVRYVVKPNPPKLPTLEQTLSDATLDYEYVSPDDFVGKTRSESGQ